MNEKDIDKLFSEAFKEAESTPPSDLWEKIEAQLPVEKKEVPFLKRYGFAIAGMAAAAILVWGLSLVFYAKYPTKNNLVVTNEPAPAKQKQQANVNTKATIVNADRVKKGTSAGTQEIESISRIALTEKKTRTAAKHTPVQAHKNVDTDIAVVKDVKHELEQVNKYVATPNEIEKEHKMAEVPVRQVTEIEPIKPLIEPEEDIESMYASEAPVAHKTVVTSLLNAISENIEVSGKKDIRFRADDEGSIRIDFINTIVKNRTKKRK